MILENVLIRIGHKQPQIQWIGPPQLTTKGEGSREDSSISYSGICFSSTETEPNSPMILKVTCPAMAPMFANSLVSKPKPEGEPVFTRKTIAGQVGVESALGHLFFCSPFPALMPQAFSWYLSGAHVSSTFGEILQCLPFHWQESSAFPRL
uniref:Uncharacterized protein n=1 Tax=Opuntia streptacantha TaxID=393608 RepID=A0A7C8YZU2_OPUST